MIPVPFLVACGVLVRFMISVKAYHRWRGINLGEEERIGRYTDKNIDLQTLSKRIQDLLFLEDLVKVKVKTFSHEDFKQRIIAKRRSLNYQDMVEVTVAGIPNDFTVSGDFSLIQSLMTSSFSTWAGFDQQRKSKNRKN